MRRHTTTGDACVRGENTAAHSPPTRTPREGGELYWKRERRRSSPAHNAVGVRQKGDNRTKPMQLRPWQQASLEKLKVQNTIVMIPTGQHSYFIKKEGIAIIQIVGGGKTLVGVKAIDYFLAKSEEENKEGEQQNEGKNNETKKNKVLFVVSTIPLVHQQADYCNEQCAEGRKAVKCTGENERKKKGDVIG